jgi:two-component system response regulator HydG
VTNQATTEERPVDTLEQKERKYIFRILKLVQGNKVRAARMLGISRATLHRRLAAYKREG